MAVPSDVVDELIGTHIVDAWALAQICHDESLKRLRHSTQPSALRWKAQSRLTISKGQKQPLSANQA